MLLGALGADVIKVEGPGERGDRQAPIPPRVRGMSALYIHQNLNKRNVVLDLSQAADRETALKLLATCDVFLNNMRATTASGLGLGYDVVARGNPRIVYCLATGYGLVGPMANMGNADPQEQAFSGWTSLQGQPGGKGEIIRQTFHIDINTSLHIAAAILEALYARERTGVGQLVDLSMHGTAIALQRTRLAEFFATGTQPPPLGSATATSVPHQAFRCQDQVWIAVGVERDQHWTALCRALEAPDLLAERRFASNGGRVRGRDELVPRLEAIFAARPHQWWLLQLRRHRVPCSPLLTFDALRYHPQVTENAYMPVLDSRWGRVHVGGPPWVLSATPATLRAGSRQGEDTATIRDSVRAVRLRERPAPKPKEDLMSGPLEGIRVVELAQGHAGPYCGQLLADAGASVVKVEPREGDYARRLGPPFHGDEGAAFVALNRNKKSAVLEGADGRRALRALLATADVVIEDRAADPAWRSVRAALARVNRSAILCTISAYGERGPLRDQPATELTIQFMTGIPPGLGRIGDPPVRVGADMTYMYAGVYAYQGVLAALYHRRRTGVAQRVAVSLLGTMMNGRGIWWTMQSDPEQWGPPHMNSMVDPPNHGIPTRTLPLQMGWVRYGREELKALLDELGADDAEQAPILAALGPARPSANEVARMWAPVTSRCTAEEVVRTFERHNGEIIVMNDLPAVVAHPQTNAIGMIATLDHPSGPLRTIGSPWRLHSTPDRPLRTAPPALGEHTREVLELAGR